MVARGRTAGTGRKGEIRMTVDKVETLRGYRAVLQRRFDQMTHAALEAVPGGEWHGMDVLRRKELERIVHEFAAADPEPLSTVAELETPGTVFLDAICPRCDIPTRILVTLHTELVVSEEGASIHAKAKSKASSHICGQLPLTPAGDDDQEQMRLADLIGPTEPTLILVTEIPAPDDVSLATPEEETCGAEAELSLAVGEDPEHVTCERRIDHEALEGGRNHWAEGGYAWHYEDRPVPRVEETVTDSDDEEDPE
jgi:hypothetical protein